MRHALLLALSAGLAGSLSAQNSDGSAPAGSPPAPSLPVTQSTPAQGVAGQRAGTESWIVHFAERPFDLAAFRAEMHGQRRPEAIATIVRGLEASMRAQQKDFVADVESLGGSVTHQWWLINGCAIEIAPRHLDTIRSMPNVARLERDRVAEPQMKKATNHFNHNSDALNARGITGQGVACAIIDSGQDSNYANSNRHHITYSRRGSSQSRLVANFKVGAMPADDVHGHGTGVASVAAGWKWRSAAADHGHAYDADIVGYAIANASNGNSSSAVQTSAFQGVARDAARYRIVAANMSYGASSSPVDSVNLAMDSASYNADVFVATAAGNSGSDVSKSAPNLNGLSVGAVKEDTHEVASFSSRGVQGGRMFPVICANGVSTDMAKRDDEYSDYVSDGTSMASPQVCGAATLVRGALRGLSSLETRALLLASCAASPGTSNGLVSTGPGAGYLRDDLAHRLASDASSFGSASVSSANPAWRSNFNVSAGDAVQIALVWNRLDLSAFGGNRWTNLELALKRGSQVLASSRTTLNTQEFLRYRSTSNETLTLEVTLSGATVGAGQQPFAWARYVKTEGQYARFGSGCAGSGRKLVAGDVVPAGLANSWGNASNSYPFGTSPMRYMQSHANNQFSRDVTMHGLAFRSGRNIAQQANQLSVTLRVGYTRQNAQFLSNSFQNNWWGSPTTAFQGTLSVPAMPAQSSPSSFTMRVPFDRPFFYARNQGHFLWECQNAGQKSANINYFDAVASSQNPACRVFFGGDSNASLGIVDAGFSLVTQVLTDGGSGALAELQNIGVPEIGKSFALEVQGAKANSAALFFLGAQRLGVSLGSAAPGCTLYCSPDVLIGTAATGANGVAGISIELPSNPALVGLGFYNQGFVLDAGVNRLGIVATNGGEARVGG